MELQNIKRLAVFKMRNIGDVLIITPLLRALREAFPSTEITVVVNSGTEAMLANNPHINNVMIYQRGGGGRGALARLIYELNFAWKLRQQHFDMTIGLTDGDRSAWYSLFAGARHRFGQANYAWKSKFDPRTYAYNRPTRAEGNMHEVLKHFSLLERAGLKLNEPGSLCLALPEDLRAWARADLAPLRPAKIVHVHAVSRWLWKCWGSAQMAEVIDWLQTKRGVRVVMTSGPAEKERQLAQEIVRLCRTQPLFHDGDLSLSQTAAISAESDGYFGVDTAPMHMAAAVGVPVIALFGPTYPENWGPWTPQAQILRHPCACNKTNSRACDWQQVRACMSAITVPEAQAALDQMLARPGASIVS